jgi:serine/threonine-protein kinase RsbT
MTGPEPEVLPLRGSADIARARHRVRDLAVQLGFDLVAQTRLVTATSELARNTHIHGGGGRMSVGEVQDGRVRGLRLVFEDDGPGIPDTGLALTEGWTSAGGLGLGLTGTRRLVHEFRLESEPGQGTRVEIVHWAGRR